MRIHENKANTWLAHICALLAICALAVGCGGLTGDPDDDNPFLEDFRNTDKADTGWVSAVNAPEVEITLESDIHTPGKWQAVTGPNDLSQFALTYLRKKHKLFIESQMVVPEQDRSVEWLLDGIWVDAEDVNVYTTPLEKLNHFRISGINAVVYKPDQPEALVGKIYEATVPLYPYFLVGSAGETCASHGSHELWDETYWYFWDPDRSECQIEMATMTATVTGMIPKDGPRYPEYDQLIADGRVEAVIFFGAFGGGGPIEEDKGFRSMQSFMRKMEAAGFVQSTSPAGLARFSRTQNNIEQIVDVSSPSDFAGLGDLKHADVFDAAVKTHEIIVYNGHSIMGTSNFWQREGIYPDTYQIFFFNGCLGYEYYVRAILDGKGSWDKADVISNIMETPAAPQPKVIASFLAATFQGAAQEGSVSYGEVLSAISRYTYNSCYGVSGARTNCFSPDGSLCEQPDPDTISYSNEEPTDIPDDDPAGVTSLIQVPDSLIVGELEIEIDLDHSWLGDLRITLEHDGTVFVLRDRVDDYYNVSIRDTFHTDEFDGLDATGTWTLTISDHQNIDSGTLNRWSIEASRQ
ncbi:MAG: proprotein convertase P-domain-containing protein [Deltaproteobacteria bacterium]|nr:proprotein convertase P-domain-containing protein [Deltaproteobacteria bacterium]